MNAQNQKIMINSERHKLSIDNDMYQTSEFNRDVQQIMDVEHNEIISAYATFIKEMNECNTYRLNLTINPIISNVLCERTTEIKRISDGSIVTGDSRIELIQQVNDIDYDYRIGYDMLDNNFFRVKTFKTGHTINDFTGTTLYDVLSINKSINENVSDENGWVSVINKTKINNNKLFSKKEPCERIDLFPTKDFLLFKPFLLDNEIKNNWDFFLTYPYENYNDSILTKDINGINGIPIVQYEIIDTTKKLLKIKTLYNHNLQINDVIKLKRNNKNTDKTYLVENIDDNYIYINIDKYSDLFAINDFTPFRVCKVIQGVDCKYYIRKFRKIPNYINNTFITEKNIQQNIDQIETWFDFESYMLSFANNIYGDPIHQIQYIDSIHTEYLKDNIGRPISEIFFTIIKRNNNTSFGEPDSIFTPVLSGIETDYTLSGYSNIRKINTVSNDDIPLEINITSTGATIDDIGQSNIFLGDIVEYNYKTVKETILVDISHRFNTVNREKVCNFTYHDISGDETNILYNSSFLGKYMTGGTDYWLPEPLTNTQLTTQETPEITGETMSLSVYIPDTSIGLPHVYTNITEVLQPDELYTLSFYIKSSTMSMVKIQIDNLLLQEVYVNEDWGYNTITITGDGGFHKLSFIAEYAWTAINFQIANVKLEKNSAASNWTPNPMDVNGVLCFSKKTTILQPNKEGYYYKPHHKITLKNYSNIVNSDKFEQITKCGDFISGITINSDIDLIENIDEDSMKYLIINTNTTNNIGDFSYVRITDENLNYINVQILIFSKLQNMLLIPYNKDFMGSLVGINNKRFTFRKFNNISTPTYSQDTYDGLCYWREFLSNGDFNSDSDLKEELIFTNNNFYISKQLNFYLKRQDPFGLYGLRNNTFPSDKFGAVLSRDVNNNTIKKQNDIC